MPEREQRIIPMYEDAAAAVEWLCKAFGLREREEMRYTDERGVVTHAELELDGALVMLATPSEHYTVEDLEGHRWMFGGRTRET